MLNNNITYNPLIPHLHPPRTKLKGSGHILSDVGRFWPFLVVFTGRIAKSAIHARENSIFWPYRICSPGGIQFLST